MVDVPTKDKVVNVGQESLIAGGLGGLAYAFGNRLGGSIGSAVGTVLAGASVGGTSGKIVAVNGVMDLVAQMFMGSSGQTSGGGAI